ncbi:MAG: hypothetical protein II579_01855, partial [Treponema sp.]|nr:hypothetical protein [Treponema sp.]
IVITHNRKTAVGASSAIGVTMEESGISKVIAIRLDEKTSNGELTFDDDDGFVEEDVPAEEGIVIPPRPPRREHNPDGTLKEESKTEDEAPATGNASAEAENAPATENAAVETEATATEETPAEAENAPATEDAPAEGETPAEEETPAEAENAPATENAAVETETNASKEEISAEEGENPSQKQENPEEMQN